MMIEGSETKTIGFYIIIHFLSHGYIFCMYCVLFTLHRGAHHRSELLTRTEPSRTSLSRTDHCVSLTEGEIEYICMNFWYKRHQHKNSSYKVISSFYLIHSAVFIFLLSMWITRYVQCSPVITLRYYTFSGTIIVWLPFLRIHDVLSSFLTLFFAILNTYFLWTPILVL